MDTSNITRPNCLPFDITPMLASDIDALIEALERDDPMLDCYFNEVEGSARSLPEEYDMKIRRYYCRGGWRKGAFSE